MLRWVAFFLALAATPLSFAQSPATVFPQPGMWALAGYDPALPTHDDLEPFRNLVGNARIVALGESYHTSAGFYLMKHRLFRFLVEEMGFRAFAIESNWQPAQPAAAYVETCAGSARQAIAGHINVWQSSEYEDLVRWMCEWNRSHSNPADKITFFGFDIQQPRDDGNALIAFLEGHGINRLDPRSQGLRSCEQVVDSYPFGKIPQERHDTCIAALAAVEQHLSTISHMVPEQDLAIATLRVKGLRAWENSVFTIAHDFEAGYNARDEGMAYAFNVMREMKAPDAKTVVWAANSHVARTKLPRGEQPMGSYLAATYGADYVNFALTAYETEIDFPGFGCGPVNRTAGSVEDQLARFGQTTLLVDSRSPALRRGRWAMGIDEVRPYRDYTGVIWLAHSPKMHPYVWPSCR